jgi:hypothetical protein
MSKFDEIIDEEWEHKDLGLQPSFVRNFNRLVGKLKLVLSENRNLHKFKYLGMKNVKKDGIEFGIYVLGQDNNGIEWKKFYPTSDIHFHYGELKKRLDR